jgi:hypothetical protein
MKCTLVLAAACLAACSDDAQLPYPIEINNRVSPMASTSQRDDAGDLPRHDAGSGQSDGMTANTTLPSATGTAPSATTQAPTPVTTTNNGASLGATPDPTPPQAPPASTTTEDVSSDDAPAEPPDEEPQDAGDDTAAGGSEDSDEPATDEPPTDEPSTDEPDESEAPADIADAGGTAPGGGFDSGEDTTPEAPQMDCTPLAVGVDSGNLGAEARCFTVTGTVSGWQVSNLGMRTLTVNGEPPAPPMLPASVNGSYTFIFGAGQPTYTAFSTW